MCFFLQVILHFVSCAEILPVLPPFASGGLCLPDVCRWEQGQPPPLPVTVCPPFGLEHRSLGDSSPLPSPLLFSSGQRSPLVVSVFLRCSPASYVLLGALALVSVPLGWLYTGIYSFFIQPRPE
jgi:hypothetical protein